MRTEIIGKHRIEMFNSIEELTAERFAIWNKMLLIDSGLGSDMAAVDDHITRAIQFINKGKQENAVQELLNMRNSFYFILENLSPKHLSYAVMIAKIDGKPMTDLSDDNLRSVVAQLGEWGATRSWLDKISDQLKKKFKRN